MDDCVIHVDNVTKTFGPVTALSGVTFRVNRGEMFCVVGPDGAG
jgi:ABC-type multidrug transport system ATPase subunit